MERLTEWRDDKKLLAKAKFSGDFGSQNILQSLAEYEDLEELIGIPLKNLAEICNNKIPEECRNPKKAIVLTDKDAGRWNEYKNAEEQGLLLRLPCEVGDTLYYISDGFIEPCTVETIFISDYTDKDGNCSYMAEIHFDREDCPYVSTEIYFTDIGKTVFLTQAEAEQKLKEIERVDMTIDEAISYCKENDLCKIAELLEELKALREEKQNKCKDCAGCTMWKCDCSNIRNKAIDDFVEKLKDHNYTSNFDWEYYDEIAEQLKVGN